MAASSSSSSSAMATGKSHSSVCQPLLNCDFALEKKLHVVLNEDVLLGVLDHAYSDPRYEIVGHLGGNYDAETSMVHATVFAPGRRVVQQLHPSSVEGDSEDLHEAQMIFEEQGLKYVGWYHSHPRIIPSPSQKDARMQSELQRQVPFSFGLICSPYFDRGTRQEASFMNVFRVALPEGEAASQSDLSQLTKPGSLLKVSYTIHRPALHFPPSPMNSANMIRTHSQSLKEARDTLNEELAKCKSSSSAVDATALLRQFELKQKYTSFLSTHMKSAIAPAVGALESDIRTTRYKLARMRETLAHRLGSAQSVDQMDQLRQLLAQPAEDLRPICEVATLNGSLFGQAEKVYADDQFDFMSVMDDINAPASPTF